MAIPTNITREHIFRAMLRIVRESIPPRRDMREWALDYEGERYPVKLLISWANVYPNGEELDPDPNNFTTYMARDYLEALEFEVLEL